VPSVSFTGLGIIEVNVATDSDLLKTVGWVANAAAFTYLTSRCGKSIGKRDWSQSVFWFLLALAIILYAVKNAASF
jgi:hypothetical protein